MDYSLWGPPLWVVALIVVAFVAIVGGRKSD